MIQWKQEEMLSGNNHNHNNNILSSGCSSSSYRDSQRHDVSYSCGSCGYDLNLTSSNRNTATIGSKYGKSIKKGIISFFQIDDNRFNKVDHIRCVPYFISKTSWGLCRTRTKLLCRKCGNHIGDAYDVKPVTACPCPDEEPTAQMKKFDIRIRALQPVSSQQDGTSLVI